MIAGGGLGEVAPDDVGPMDVQAPAGTVDVVVADEAEAVAVARELIGMLRGPAAPTGAPDPSPGARPAGVEPDQARMRTLVPERDRRAYDVTPVLETLADAGSVIELREEFAPEMLTAFARIEGRPVGVIANNTTVLAGAITAAASDKAARHLQLCQAYGIPVLSLVDTPGYMVGPAAEAEALVRRASRLLVAGAALTVPLVAVILRRAYGLGAQAMVGGSLHEPALTVAWPSAHLGPMGLEGAVRLGLRHELAQIADEDERETRVTELTAMARENAAALNAARLFEIDDVIDPADTRALVAATLAAAEREDRPAGHRFVDVW